MNRVMHFLNFAHRHPAARRPGQVHLLRPGPRLVAAAGRQARRRSASRWRRTCRPTRRTRRTILVNNIEWWADNQDEVEAKFQAWLDPVALSHATGAAPGPASARTTEGRDDRRDRRTGARPPRADARRRRPAAQGEPRPRAAGAEAAGADADRAAAALRARQLPLPDRRHAVPLGREPDRPEHPAADRRGAADWDAAQRPSSPASRSSRRCTTTSSRPSRQKTNTRLGSRLNYENSGMSSLMRGDRPRRQEDGSRPALQGRSSSKPTRSWGDPPVWQTIKLFSGPYTSGYLLNAVDLQRTPDGIALKPPAERIYVKLFIRTLVMSLAITFACLAARLPDRLPAREPAAAQLEPAADPGAAAVLDLAPGAHRLLEGAAAAAGRHQRHPGLGSGSSPTPTGW